MSPPADTIPHNVQALRQVYVNIYDLIETVRIGREPRMFETERALADYSKNRDMLYPMRKAKGNLMKYILRQILRPRRGPRARVAAAP
jgi:hypothetical protein